MIGAEHVATPLPGAGWGWRLQVDLSGVLGTVGITLIVMGVAQLFPVMVALVDPRTPTVPLLVGALGTALMGFLLVPLRSRASKWTRRESLAIVALSWAAAILAATVPYVASGTTGLLDGLVEAASGVTTTGSTVLPDVDPLPAPIVLWRSLTHWLGGAGIVLIVLVLAPFLGNAEELRRTQRAEASFFTERYRGSTRSTLKGLLVVYVGATALLTMLLILLEMSPWDAVNHAFSTVATGGFSSRSASLGAFGPAVHVVTILFMVLGALSFASLGRAVADRDWRAPLRNVEVRGYLKMLGVVSLGMGAILFWWGDAARYGAQGVLGLGRALVDATFTVISMSTTAGFLTVDYTAWPAVGQVVLLCLMLIGGCSGSTAGGIKFRRVMVIVRHVHLEIRRLAIPRAIVPLQVGEHVVTPEELRESLTYVVSYGLLILVFAVLIAGTGADPVSAGSMSVSGMGSIGPSWGAAGPTGDFSRYAPAAKLLVVIAMLLGRLEIFPVLSVLLPSFWLRRR